MKLKAALILFVVILTLSLPVSAKKRSFGRAVSDEFIALKIHTKFMKDKSVPANDIMVGVRSGVVTLKGELKSQDQINRAIEIAERQKGVKEVKAYLVLKEFGELRSQKTARKDVSQLERDEKKPFLKNLFKPQKNSESEKIGLPAKSNLKEKDLDLDNEEF